GSARGTLSEVTCHGAGLAIAPGEDWLAVGDLDDRVVIMSLDGTVRARLHGHTSLVAGIAITPDGGRVVSASDCRTIRVGDVAAAVGEPGEDPPARHDPDAVAMAGDGSYLVTAERGGLILWDPGANPLKQGTGDWRSGVAVSTDGALIASTEVSGH